MKTQESQFGYVLEGKIYLKAFLDKSDRAIGEVVDGEETSIKYFEERFSKVQEKVDELIKIVDIAENKGSFLMKIIHLRESLNTYNALGDFESLYKSLDILEEKLKGQIHANHERNLEQKRNLMEELKAVLESPYLQESVDTVKNIQQRWVKTGKVPKEFEETMDLDFKNLTNQFFDDRKEHIDIKKQVTDQRILQYQELLKQAKALLDKANYEHDAEVFKQLQKDWKELGFIPKNSLAPLWQQFKELGDAFFQGYKTYLKTRKKNIFKKNTDKIAEKEALVEKAKALYDLPVQEAVELSKKLQKEWKAIGFIPKTEELQNEFYLASDFVFEYQYVVNLAHAKDKSFDKRDQSEQNQRMVRLIRSLIDRDQQELQRYQENASSIVIRSSSNDSVFDKVIDARLNSLERKLKAKKLILQKFK